MILSNWKRSAKNINVPVSVKTDNRDIFYLTHII